MTDDIKRGSSGGTARAEKLSKEERKAIASAAAKARWAKAKESNSIPRAEGYVEPVPAVVLTPTTVDQIPEKRPKTRRKARMPKEFGRSLDYAEKRLADAMKERAEAMGRVAALNAEIPSLVQIIKALKSTEQVNFNPQAYQAVDSSYYLPQISQVQPTIPVPTPMVPNPTQVNLPPVPMAHGGAMEFDGGQQELPEDAFLKDTVGGNAGWR